MRANIDRLTMKNVENINIPLCRFEDCDTDEELCPIELLDENQCKCLRSVIDRLAELEGKLEQGTLIELPCKVGDMVYVDNRTLFNNYCYSAKYYEPCEVIGIRITRKQKLLNIAPHKAQAMNTRYHKFYPFSVLGKTVFLTKSEAELERRKSNEKKCN